MEGDEEEEADEPLATAQEEEEDVEEEEEDVEERAEDAAVQENLRVRRSF